MATAVDSERRRHELYISLERAHGTEIADTLMSYLPPVGWVDVATKDDIAAVRHELSATRKDIGRLEEATRKDITRLEEITTELKEALEGKATKSDVEVAKNEMLHLQEVTRKDLTILRQDMDLRFARFETKIEKTLRESSRNVILAVVGIQTTTLAAFAGGLAFTG